MPTVLILGGGFGGLIMAERLAASLDSSYQITLVAPNKKFTFYPALVRLAFGKCTPEDISFDLAAKLRDLGVRFVQGEALNIDTARRTVEITGEDFEGEIYYDYLVIAAGRRLATEKVPGFFEHAHHLLGTGAAIKFGAAVNSFGAGQIIVGMCPDARLPIPVCETAFALSQRFDEEIRSGKIQLKVIFPESLEAAFGGAPVHHELEAAFKRHGINVLYDVPINEISPNEILSTKKHAIKHNLLMLVPPFQGQTIVGRLGDKAGYAPVSGRMQVRGLERTYAVGDIVAFSGPKLAHMAVRQASVAADNILSEIRGEEPSSEYYHEINAVIDESGSDSLHLHYGIWDDRVFALKQGAFWSWAKNVHSRLWQARHD